MSILLYTTSESHTFIATDPRMPSNINLRTYMYALHIETLKWKKQPTKKKIRRRKLRKRHTQRFNIWKSLTVTYLHGFSSEKQNVLHNSKLFTALAKVIYYMENIWTVLQKLYSHTHAHTYTHDKRPEPKV